MATVEGQSDLSLDHLLRSPRYTYPVLERLGRREPEETLFSDRAK